MAQGVTVRRSLLISIGDANIDLYRDTAAMTEWQSDRVTVVSDRVAVISDTQWA